jgi:hypothetical protein
MFVEASALLRHLGAHPAADTIDADLSEIRASISPAST